MSALAGRHALVTGGGSGIGAAVARLFCAEGASVTITGRASARLEAVANEIGASFAVADVTDGQAVAAAVADAAAANGPVDILVNNAGAAEAMPFVKIDDAHWDRMIAVNLTGVRKCTLAVIRPMLEAGYGRIVNVASIAGLRGFAYASAYSVAKHGVIGLTRSLALEFANRGVAVNAVCPGYTDTDMVQKAIDNIVAATGRSRDKAVAELAGANASGRLIQPREVASCVLDLCSGEFVTGQAIEIE